MIVFDEVLLYLSQTQPRQPLEQGPPADYSNSGLNCERRCQVHVDQILIINQTPKRFHIIYF
jgi:hypothetical protein